MNDFTTDELELLKNLITKYQIVSLLDDTDSINYNYINHLRLKIKQLILMQSPEEG